MIGDIPLCELCPRLFALDSAPNICVAAKMAGPLDTSFRRSVRGGVEQQEFSDLSSFLNSVVLSTSNDRWYFSISSSGEFSVKDTRLAIDDLVLPSHSEPTRWVKLIPIKINVFMWRARRGCLPTRYNLVQKGVILESTSCPVCFSDEEDVQHFYFDVLYLRRFCIVFAVGGRSISSFGVRSQNGTSGSLLFVFRVQLKVFWKESSTLLGGLFGDFGIVLLLMLISRLDRSFLRILSLPPFFGVIVGVVGSSLGMIGLKTRI
ncbi:RNA-directed DNA polymerase, eukaryota [Tanacetum coccineum]|uniref:RNA-directed DNA polymerase, eukaryota n=1 Tax=Tanacetum coccineum TaxID=301880 RepID=A0ABQ4WXK3_9ASTR